MTESKLCLTESKPATLYLGQAPKLAEEIVKSLCERKKHLVLAESCTGGLASDFIVQIPGASKVFWGSYITYTDDAKIKMLGVPAELLKKHGAVSREAAIAMAEGALKQSGAEMAVSITGIAGPDSDESQVPIGTVWIGLAGIDEDRQPLYWSKAKAYLFFGARNEIREAAATTALEWVVHSLTRGGTSV